MTEAVSSAERSPERYWLTRFVILRLYRYEFAPPGNQARQWRKRERLGLWLPPLSADDPELRGLLRQAGWLTE